ncbi:MAG: sulfatase-like hydrolase/transferase [Cyclobacteriaceae bacterium]
MLISIFYSLLLSLIPYRPQAEQPNILFLIADDWSYPHAGIYGDPVVHTPTFDLIAREGALFHHAYAAAPSCSASRASILTGRFPHQLESGGNLWSEWPAQFPTYVSMLEENGYFTGSTRKGWGPGDFSVSGLIHNPAGK